MINLRAPARPEELVGSLISERFRLTRLLGSGGMGGVYAAVDDSGAPCAVKVVRGDLAGEEGSRRLVREGKLVSRLRDPHIVPVLESGYDTARDLPFLVMPLLEGRDLARLLVETGALDPVIAVRLAIQACKGLEEAHAAGIIHRDVKPQNLLLCEQPDGEVVLKVGDFGIAKRLEHFDDTQVTRTGRSMGSPAYMSPEQAKGDKELDQRTDIWSLGVTLYELLSGKTPWGDSKNPSDLEAAIRGGRVPSIQELAPWVEPGLAKALHRALDRDREGRWPSAAVFAAELDAFAGGTCRVEAGTLRAIDPERTRAVVPPAEPRVTASLDAPAKRAPAQRTLLILSVVGGIALAILAVLFALLRSSGAAAP